MIDFRRVAAAGALLLAAATSASAATLAGRMEITGSLVHGSAPFEIGTTLTLGDSAVVRPTSGDFFWLAGAPAVDLSSVTWTLDKSANVGLRFGVDIFDIEVTRMLDVGLPGEPLGWGVDLPDETLGRIIARGVVTAPWSDETDVLIVLAANAATGGYRMEINADISFDDDMVPEVPVPAALPMLVGGLGLLAAAAGRRRARRA